MGPVRVAIVGVGNCASSLVQGVEYYRNADPDETVPGLMHVVLGGYHVGDCEFVTAFDVDAAKVGLDLGKAGHTLSFPLARLALSALRLRLGREGAHGQLANLLGPGGVDLRRDHGLRGAARVLVVVVVRDAICADIRSNATRERFVYHEAQAAQLRERTKRVLLGAPRARVVYAVQRSIVDFKAVLVVCDRELRGRQFAEHFAGSIDAVLVRCDLADHGGVGAHFAPPSLARRLAAMSAADENKRESFMSEYLAV